MRHDDIRKPFTVQGDLQFVLRAFGMPEDMKPDRAHDAFSDYVARVCTATGKACMITTWHATTTGDRTTYVVQAEPIRVASPADPWVKVGTTTIDGSLDHVARLLTTSFEEAWPVVDAFLRDDDGPWLVGGRWLRPHGGSVYNGLAVIRCDIVRRQSEIDEEMMRSVAPSINELSATMRRMDPCPECGPHGNRGEVLLASSWAKCTTCAGGKPGDLWGEVKAEQKSDVDAWMAGEVPHLGETDDEYRQRVRSHFDPVGHKPGCFGVPTVAELANYVEAQLEAVCRATMMPREVLFGTQSSASIAEHHALCWRALYGVS